MCIAETSYSSKILLGSLYPQGGLGDQRPLGIGGTAFHRPGYELHKPSAAGADDAREFSGGTCSSPGPPGSKGEPLPHPCPGPASPSASSFLLKNLQTKKPENNTNDHRLVRREEGASDRLWQLRLRNRMALLPTRALELIASLSPTSQHTGLLGAVWRAGGSRQRASVPLAPGASPQRAPRPRCPLLPREASSSYTFLLAREATVAQRPQAAHVPMLQV